MKDPKNKQWNLRLNYAASTWNLRVKKPMWTSTIIEVSKEKVDLSWNLNLDLNEHWK